MSAKTDTERINDLEIEVAVLKTKMSIWIQLITFFAGTAVVGIPALFILLTRGH
jgi:hypothetical protein